MNDLTIRQPVKPRYAKGPLSTFQTLKRVKKNVLGIIPEAALYEPVISDEKHSRWHMVTDPEMLRHVLKDNLPNYPKSLVMRVLLRPGLGDSILLSEGAQWKWQRRTSAPVFSPRNVAALGPIMTRAAEQVSDQIADKAQSGPVNVYDDMVQVTFDIIANVTFSGDEGLDGDTMHRLINAYTQTAGKLTLMDILAVPEWVPRPSRLLARRTIKALHKQADRAIELRRKGGHRDRPHDLLDMMLNAEDPETGRKMSTKELRDNLLTFVIAGHETTALALSWAIYLLAFDPARQEKAREEARAVLGGRAATAEDVAKLPYIRAIIDEALRLYPPAALVGRNALKSDTVKGTEISSGEGIMIPILALHRHRKLWDAPDEFLPERWLPPNKAPDRFAYLPFGDGPRVCIGASFAIQESVIVLATLLARFRFTAVPDKTPEPVMVITMRPEGGVWMNVEPL